MKKYVVNSNMPFLMGDSYRYETVRGIISLIHPCTATMHTYEIYCISGNLFTDNERYETLEEAEERINKLLNFKFGK